MIYLDHAATTPIRPEVLDAMMPYLKEDYGNAGAIYELGRRAANAIAKARRQVAELIGCEPSQIIFTSSGSEANNLVFAGLRSHLLATGKTHIVTSKTEHDSVLKSVKSLCNPLCHNAENNIKPHFDAAFLQVNRDCIVNTQDLLNSITDKTGLVSVMYINNETGAINPVKEIGNICKQRGILFHTDCVQAMGFQNIDVNELGCDFLSISSHKINAPKGVGALYVRNPSMLTPLINGGGGQEFGYRGGTENVAGIVGLGKACEILREELEINRATSIKLRTLFEKSLRDELQNRGLGNKLHINSTNLDSKILSMRFDNIDGQTLLLLLDTAHIYASAGSACRSNKTTPSHVLLAMGLTEDEARDSIRVSFSHTQTEAEIKCAASSIASGVKMLDQNSMTYG